MRAVVLALAFAALVPAGCGDDSADSEPLPYRSVTGGSGKPPPEVLGSWTAVQPGGYRLAYTFSSDGRYEYSSVVRQERDRGMSSFRIRARGTVAARGASLVLRPRNGTKERRDPDDPSGDYKRRLERFPQRYGWSVRGKGEDAKLTLTIGGGLRVVYERSSRASRRAVRSP